MTVGEFKVMLSRFSEETVVTFGSSSYSRRPLVFYRIKKRDVDSLSIEMNELTLLPATAHEPKAEHEERVTVGYILLHLENFCEDCKLFFDIPNASSDFVVKAVVPAVAVDLVQTKPPLTL